MSAQIIELVSEDAVDKAWNAYAQEACKLVAEPSLIANRSFNEELARRHERWVRLFLIQDRCK